jgi:RNA polymerase sigma-54 factor
MKHSLQLKLSQHLTLTPQLQQSIRLLQLSTLDLNQELERFLAENPMLERAEGWNEAGSTESPGAAGTVEAATADKPSETASDDTPVADSWEQNDNWTVGDTAGPGWREDEDGEYPQQQAAGPSLVQHLVDQLQLMQLSERDRQIVMVLIAHLDEDGYLVHPLEELQAALPPELEVDPQELQIALKLIQSLDPVGVGARSLSECLSLQIEAMPDDTPCRAAALSIARTHLDLLAARDFTKLKRLHGLDDANLRAARALITGLNPKPGSDFTPLETRYVVPDVIVRRVKGRWVASLNQEAMPKLRVNKMYAEILQRNRDSGGQQLSGQLQEARWLIKNVQQRFETILRVSQAIVDRQKHFFEHGEVAMRPLVLREIADTVGLHESTVSRVTTQKYMLTPRGIFELKYFFGSHVATETGGAASSTAIRALIKQLVGAEDPKKPLSDSRISDILAQQGIVVARRTIAKYREAMQIHPASQRKSI